MFGNYPIAVIGGSGKSGAYLVRELLLRKIPLRLLLRDPNAFTLNHPLIEKIKGDAREAEDVFELLKGTAAVISTLGQPVNQPSIFSQASANVLRAMKSLDIDRYIVTTGLNVDAAGDKKGEITAAGTEWMKQNYPKTTADKQIEYSLLAGSASEWTLIRLPLISLSDQRKSIKISLEDCPGNGIGAADLAHFLADQLNDQTYLRQAPFIAN